MPITQTLTAPGTAPARYQDPDIFIARMDARLAWENVNASEMTTLIGQINSTASQMSSDAATATAQAGIATAKAAEASGSATTALGSANAAASDAANTAVLLANAGSMLGINFGAFTMVDNELIVTHLTTATPSIVNGDLILDYETL